MPRKQFRRHGVILGVDTTALDLAVHRMQHQGVAAAASIAEEAARGQFHIARREWGVETGAGRRSLRLIRTTVRDVFVVRVFSKYPPVKFQSFDGSRPTFWQVLVRRPLKKIQKKLAKLSAKAMIVTSLGDQRKAALLRRQLRTAGVGGLVRGSS